MKELFLVIFALSAFLSCVSEADMPLCPGRESYRVSERLSSSIITSICQDKDGFIWIGTQRGLNKFNGIRYHSYFHDEADSTSLPSNFVNCLLVDSEGRLWVGTRRGLACMDRDGHFRNIASPSSMNNVFEVWEDRHGGIFVNFIEYLCRLNPESGELEVVTPEFDPSHRYVNYCFPELETDRMWSVTSDAIRLWDLPSSKILASFDTHFESKYAFLDPDGLLWLSSSTKTEVFDTRSLQFDDLPSILGLSETPVFFIVYDGSQRLRLYTRSACIAANTTLRKIESKQGNDGFIPNSSFVAADGGKWLGSAGKGYKVEYQRSSRFNLFPDLDDAMKEKTVTSMSFDGDKLWLATMSNEIYRFNPATGEVTKMNDGGIFKEKLPTDMPMLLSCESLGNLWVVNAGILFHLEPRGDNLKLIGKYFTGTNVSCLTCDSGGTLWVGALGNRVYRKTRGERDFTPFTFSESSFTMSYSLAPAGDGNVLVGSAFNNPVLLSADGRVRELPLWEEGKPKKLVTCMLQDRDGRIWVGTNENGLFVYDSMDAQPRAIKGLSCQEICALAEDPEGNIWASGMSGLNRISTDGSIISFYEGEGLHCDNFHDGSVAVLPDGSIFFGSLNGITAFRPGDRIAVREVPIYFETLSTDNSSVYDVSDASQISLTHRQDHFTLSFASPDYGTAVHGHYFYKLEGHDPEWIDAFRDGRASYSNLSPGRYTFRVKLAESAQDQALSQNTLSLVVRPAPWVSWWAVALYIILAATVIWTLISYQLRLVRERETARRLSMNSSFFANISHEFRTPLTMISGPVSELQADKRMPDDDKPLVQTIRQNTDRMLRLVNQLMDFNKVENDTLNLQVSSVDVIAALRRSIAPFETSLSGKGIFVLENLDDSYLAWIDEDKLDKIMANLFSNAIKFTPQGGRISCSFDVIPLSEARTVFKDATCPSYIKVEVADSGPGIAPQMQEKVFERFFQIENKYNLGSGIGLYFCKRLVELHHGFICAGNKKEGGAVFTFLLPAQDVYSPEEKAPADMEQEKLYPIEAVPEAVSSLPVRDPSKKTILLVDDDTDIVRYLSILLQKDYGIIYRFEAEGAMESIRKDAPDLVISDIGMPGTSGVELCRKIKSDLSTSHIPVILLTAKTATEDKVSGLDAGADAYVVKPFEPDYLRALVRSRLRNRERIREILSERTEVPEQEEELLGAQDKAFMKDLYALMENELSNQELNINSLTERLMISRSKLYYKIKGLTGDTPKDFFRKFKLNRAAELLKDGRYNISEVADMTGWGSLSVFTRNFKSHFGETPSEYISKK